MKYIVILFFFSIVFISKYLIDYNNENNINSNERVIKSKHPINIYDKTKYIVIFYNGNQMYVRPDIYNKINVDDTVHIGIKNILIKYIIEYD